MSEITEEMLEQGRHLIHGTAEESILSRFAVFRDMEPEDDESWESWYHAAFDMLEDEVRQIFALTAAFASRPSQGGEWVMVPREPTAEMRLAGKEEHLAQEAVGGFRSDQAVSIYRAMLSAAQVKP